MRVGVIGAGIAGLVTAKVLRDDGFDVTVFEQEPAVGGVWVESRTYPGLRTNNSRDTYGFSDHPYDRSADAFPTAADVREYLASYVTRFHLSPLIRLSTEVVGVSRAGDAFEVAVRGLDGPATLQFDFVVVCAGTFSEPQVPQIAGSERFDGVLLHSSQATDPGLFEGRRVVVVGAGKSALDCAAWAAAHAQSCTLLFRAPHWMAPRFLPGGIPSDRLTLTRLSESFFRYHRLSRFETFLHGSGRGLTRLVWLGTCRFFRLVLGMPAVMIPDRPLPAGIENTGVGKEFYDMARRGQVNMLRDEIAAFPGGGEVLLASGDRVAADVVIFATGWRQSLTFLAPELRSAVVHNGHFRLYRHILAPTEQRLGFVGYAASNAGPLTAEISAHWLSESFRGDLKLPSVEAMQAEIHRVSAWLSEALPARPHGYWLGPYLAHYIDDLVADMGLPTRRTSNFVTEHLGTFLPVRYRNLAEELRQKSTDDTRRRRPHYFGAGHALGLLVALALARVAHR